MGRNPKLLALSIICWGIFLIPEHEVNKIGGIASIVKQNSVGKSPTPKIGIPRINNATPGMRRIKLKIPIILSIFKLYMKKNLERKTDKIIPIIIALADSRICWARAINMSDLLSTK